MSDALRERCVAWGAAAVLGVFVAQTGTMITLGALALRERSSSAALAWGAVCSARPVP